MMMNKHGDIKKLYMKKTVMLYILKYVKKWWFSFEKFGGKSEKHYFCSVLLMWYTCFAV